MTCIECNTSTDNPSFCSRSCAAKHNNKTHPKRKLTGTCKECKCSISSSRTFCFNCFEAKKVDWSKITYAEATGIRKYQKNSRIRELARRIYAKSNKPKFCMICGYDKHYEVCHIKSISDHLETATIAEINDLSNMIALCPNHHWELDYGDLTI